MAYALPFSGCQHYKRKLKIISPCCKKIYVCRLCHDEKESHKINRTAIRNIVCGYCNKQQTVNQHCRFCGIKFGKYCCLLCNLFDDEEKGQFHCQKCGICRAGFAERFFHCEVCNLCLSKEIRFTHKCIQNASRIDCPVCLEDIHTSRELCHIPKCTHMLHVKCKNKLVETGFNKCPICSGPLQ